MRHSTLIQSKVIFKHSQVPNTKTSTLYIYPHLPFKMSRSLTQKLLSTYRHLHSPPTTKFLALRSHAQNISPVWRNRIPHTRNFSSSKDAYDPLHRRRTIVLLSLNIASIALTYLSLQRPESNDAPPDNPLSSQNAKGARVEVIKPGLGSEEVEQVPTGTSTVPYFPRKIQLPRSGAVEDGKSRTLPAGTGAMKQDEEYQLIGLGIRTVSFLRIQVYVVGLYVACSDLSKLQASMVQAAAAPGATTLIEDEKNTLRRTLTEGPSSEKLWSETLQRGDIQTAFRIVPTRGTDFGHLRDGWVRGITARSKGSEFDDEGFKTAVGEFKKVFGGRKLGKGKALLLGRAGSGELSAWVEEGDDMVPLGGVQDERIGRLVWLGYLAGDNVASEGARKSIVEGVVELGARPIGTVETRVV